MRIAVPLANGRLALHFGHCEAFALVDVDTEKNEILKRDDIQAPPHEPGLLPPWLAERQVSVIIAGGMGQRALDLFTQHQIKVILGAPSETPEQLIKSYLAFDLKLGKNLCDH